MTQADVQRNAVVAWMAKHDGDFGYTNDYRRRDPERYGWGDCSSDDSAGLQAVRGYRNRRAEFQYSVGPRTPTRWRRPPHGGICHYKK